MVTDFWARPALLYGGFLERVVDCFLRGFGWGSERVVRGCFCVGVAWRMPIVVGVWRRGQEANIATFKW